MIRTDQGTKYLGWIDVEKTYPIDVFIDFDGGDIIVEMDEE